MGAYHRPIPHVELVETAEKVARNRGLHLEGEQLVSQMEGAILFAVFDFDREADRETRWAMGLRSSTNARISIELLAARRISIADTLVFAGEEISLRHRSTRRIDLMRLLEGGFTRYEERMETLDLEIAAARRVLLEREGVEAALFRAVAGHAMPSRLLHRAAEIVFRPPPSFTDVLGCDGPGPMTLRPSDPRRSLWGVHNACARALTSLPPAAMLRASRRLGAVLGLAPRP